MSSSELTRLRAERDDLTNRINETTSLVRSQTARIDMMNRAIIGLDRAISSTEQNNSWLARLDCEDTSQWHGARQRQAVTAYTNSHTSAITYLTQLGNARTALQQLLNATTNERNFNRDVVLPGLTKHRNNVISRINSLLSSS